MKKNFFTKTLALLASMLVGHGMAAAASFDVTIDDLQVPVGEEYTVEVKLTSSEAVINPNFDVALPSGLTFVEGSQAKGGDLLQRSHALGVAKQSDGSYRFLVTSTANAPLKATEGVLATFKVKASNSFASRSIVIRNKAAMVETATGYDQLSAPTSWSSVSAVIAMDGEASFSVSKTAVDVAPGTPFAVDVLMANTASIVAMQADLTLPEGVELVANEDGNIGYTDRIPASTTIEATKNGDKWVIYMSTMTNEVVDGNSGALFTLNLKADKSMAAKAQVVLDNIVVSCKNGAGAEYDDVFTIELTNLNESLKAGADQQVTDLKAQLDEAVKAIADDMKEEQTVKDAVAAAEAEVKKVEDAVAAAYEAGTLPALTIDTKAANDAIAAIAAAVKQIEDERTAVAAEAAAQEQAAADLAALKDAAAKLAVSETVAASDNAAVKTAVAAANDAIAAAQAAVAAVETEIAKGELSTTNKESLASAIKEANEKIAAAKAAVEAAEKAYADEKAKVDAAEQAALTQAQVDAAVLKTQADNLVLSAEVAASDNAAVKAAADTAADAIAAAQAAVKAVEDLIAEGKLATDNKVKLAAAIQNAKDKIAAAKTAIENAKKVYDDEKAKADAAVAAEQAAAQQAAVDLALLQAQADELAVSEEAAACDDQTVKTAVAAADKAIAAAQAAVKAVEDLIAEGKLSTDNKAKLAVAIQTAKDKIVSAKTAVAAADSAYANFATGIDTVKADEGKVEYYLPSGKRVENPVRGSVVIVKRNGAAKKVIF